jgi:DNA-binding SARP family transcriptional activator
VVVGAGELVVTSRRQRALLVLFVMNANTVVTADRLIDQLWNGAPPPGALVTLRSYISHIRKALDERVDGRARIVTTDSGYRLEVDAESLDIVRFRRAIAAGHRHLRAGESQQALAAFDAALAMWRGEPVAELADHEASMSLAAELLELRAGATEGRLRALVETGRHVEAISGLESLVAVEPLRESPHELLMVSLYRAGRSAEALDVHRRFRGVLQEQLGIDPSAHLDQLVTAILNRDPRLDIAPSSAPAPVALPAEQSAVEMVRSMLETLQTVGNQLTAVVDLLGEQLDASSPELAALKELAEAFGPGYSRPTVGEAAIAS